MKLPADRETVLHSVEEFGSREHGDMRIDVFLYEG